MPELIEILVAKRKSDHEQKKFFAALQGVELGDAETSNKKQTTFADIKARVFSGGAAQDANDILSLQGINAQQAGFGIGMGLEYTDAKTLEETPKW